MLSASLGSHKRQEEKQRGKHQSFSVMRLLVKVKSQIKIAAQLPDFQIRSVHRPVIWLGFLIPLSLRWWGRWNAGLRSPRGEASEAGVKTGREEAGIDLVSRLRAGPLSRGLSTYGRRATTFILIENVFQALENVGYLGNAGPGHTGTQRFVSCHCFLALMAHTHYFSTTANSVTSHSGPAGWSQTPVWFPKDCG